MTRGRFKWKINATPTDLTPEVRVWVWQWASDFAAGAAEANAEWAIRIGRRASWDIGEIGIDRKSKVSCVADRMTGGRSNRGRFRSDRGWATRSRPLTLQVFAHCCGNLTATATGKIWWVALQQHVLWIVLWGGAVMPSGWRVLSLPRIPMQCDKKRRLLKMLRHWIYSVSAHPELTSCGAIGCQALLKLRTFVPWQSDGLFSVNMWTLLSLCRQQINNVGRDLWFER